MNLRKENQNDLTIADQQALAQTIIELSDEEMENIVGGCDGPQGYGAGISPANASRCGCGYGAPYGGYGFGGDGIGGWAFPAAFGSLGGW